MTAIFLLSVMVLGQLSGFDQNPDIDRYIREALDSNLAVQQQYHTVERSEAAFAEARGLFYPSVNVQSRYTRADGGRTIDIPIGDLMNPVYGTLNEILIAQGQEPAFPESIENEEIAFLREREHDTNVQIQQALFQPVLLYNLSIRDELKQSESSKLDVLKRDLILEVKTAYYNYLKTTKLLELLADTEILLRENLNLSQSLYSNDKVTQDVVFRAEAELSLLSTQIAEAKKQNRTARSYFNFLLNRPLTEDIDIIDVVVPPETVEIDFNEAILTLRESREELDQVQAGIRAAKWQAKIAKSRYYPTLNGAIQYGFEGEDYQFDRAHDYWHASLLFSWNIFRGFQDSNRLKQASHALRVLELQSREIENSLILEMRDIIDSVTVAFQSMQSTESRQLSAQKSFRIVSRKFEEGIAPHLEYLDARNTKTNAELSFIFAQFDYLLVLARVERVLCLYPLHEETIVSPTGADQ